MALNNAAFRYKAQKGPLHKLPAGLKLLIFLPLSAFCFSLHPPFLVIGIAAFILLAFICGFTLREQICDIQPAFFYALLMYAVSVFSTLLDKINTMPFIPLALATLIPQSCFVLAALRLLLVVQLSALLFRSTSILEIREAIAWLERGIRESLLRIPSLRKISPKPRIAVSIALFASFIPELFATWSQINMAWTARGGKAGIRKIKILVFALISLSFEKASRKARALAARG